MKDYKKLKNYRVKNYHRWLITSFESSKNSLKLTINWFIINNV